MNHPLFLILVIAALTGCAGHPALEHPRYAPTIVPAVVNESPATRGSSLYSTATEVMLFEDVKASRVGDIVSVLLAERTNASKSNDSSVTKSNEATIGNPILGGEQRDVLGSFRGWDFNLGFGLESDQAFSGAGASNQSNQLSGTIAVTVIEELPRGNLIIQGEKWISLNQGSEYIRIRGIVRKSDISSANTILSTQIADARIGYGGTGAPADARKMGWLSRFFNSALQPY